MFRNNYFWHCTHTHGVCSNHSKKTVLGTCFKIWSTHGSVNTLSQGDTLFGRNCLKLFVELRTVRFAHVWKSWTKRLDILSTQWIFCLQIDMVVDQHHIALLPFQV